MKNFILAASLIICVGLAACSSTGKSPGMTSSGTQKASYTASPLFPDIDSWLADSKLSINTGKETDPEYDKAFSQGIVLAYGEGYPLADAEGAGQKRLTAVRAAEVTAQRNLADFFARQAINGEIRFNTYSTKLEAFLKGAHVAVSEYNPDLGRAAVVLKLDLRGAKGFAR